MNKNVVLEQEWDKTFKLDENVNHEKVVFHNRFGIDLVGDLYSPKNISEDKLPALAVCGPFGAVKEQASGLYAMEMAKRGFITLAFDPSYTGESGGYPRYNASDSSHLHLTLHTLVKVVVILVITHRPISTLKIFNRP